MTSTDPDWAALYEKHRDSMFRVAAKVLRDQGIAHQAEDAVSAAILSLMDKPPTVVDNWEALLVTVAKRKALDIIKSAGVARTRELVEDSYWAGGDDADGAAVMEWIDKVRRAKQVVSEMDERERYVLANFMIADRPRAEVASELGVSPSRISQMARKISSEIEATTGEGG